MFGLKKKEKNILAAGTGKIVPITEVPDEVFAQKMLGDGAAVLLEDGTVYAPADGIIVSVAETLHAYCITSDDGLDILVHIGINTVELKGEGFTPMVHDGDKVKAGDVLAKVDLDLLRAKNYPLYTPVLITNMDAVKQLSFPEKTAEGGRTVMLTYQN